MLLCETIALIAELLGEDALVQAVAGVEHHEQLDVARLGDADRW